MKPFFSVFEAAVLSVLLILGAADSSSLWAQGPKGQAVGVKKNWVERTEAKSLSGQVSYVDSDYISIVYDRNNTTGEESEIGFWLDGSEALERKNALSEIHYGDAVQISFDEVVEEYDGQTLSDGTVAREKSVGKRKARGITFVRPAAGPMTSR
ncbi:MAG: hypothetical protein HYY14_06745 [Candidatus Omnitrophica bacterium]|nr:hypothetical protein [Candidatus Omnitrophota bacterium]